MRKYLFKVLCIFLVISCMTGCSFRRLSDEAIAEYQVLDYNIIWEDAVRILRKNSGVEEVINDSILGHSTIHHGYFYEITDISMEEYIAYLHMEYLLLETWCIPTVMVHKDKGLDYQLDPCSGKIIATFGKPSAAPDEADWMSVGKYVRRQVVAEIEQALAQVIIDAVTAEQPDYLTIDPDAYFLSFPKTSPTSGSPWLAIQFSVDGYPNLTWWAALKQDKMLDCYLIMLMDSNYDEQYIRCNEQFSELIQQIVDEYGLETSAQ